MSDIEAAAKELWGQWEAIVSSDIVAHGFDLYHQSWEELPLLQRKAWINVAEHVIKEHIDLFGMIFAPDHR